MGVLQLTCDATHESRNTYKGDDMGLMDEIKDKAGNLVDKAKDVAGDIKDKLHKDGDKEGQAAEGAAAEGAAAGAAEAGAAGAAEHKEGLKEKIMGKLDKDHDGDIDALEKVKDAAGNLVDKAKGMMHKN